MNPAPLPSPLLRPLASNDELLDCLARITGEAPEAAARMLLDEERRLGVNVRRLLLRRDPRWGRDLAARLPTSPATERPA